MRFPLVCLVVVIHSFSFIEGWDIEQLDFNHLSGADIYSLFCISQSMTLSHIAVPTFFVISGYLFFQGFQLWNWQTYFSKINKRMYTLLFPYIVWNSFYIVMVISMKMGGVIMKGKPLQGIIDWWNDHNGFLMYYHAESFSERVNWLGGEGLFSFPILVPMWYIRDLIVLCILSPVVYGLLCRNRKRWGYITLFIMAFLYISAIYPFIPGLSPAPLLFFSVGAYLSLNGYSIATAFKKFRIIAFFSFVALWIILIPLAGYRTKTGNWFYPWFIIAGVITIFNLFALLIKGNNKDVVLSEICTSGKILKFCLKHEADVFFIFAAHSILLPYIDKILMKGCRFAVGDTTATILAFSECHPLLFVICYLLKIIITIALCILISKNINDRLPKTRLLLMGR